MKKMFVLFAAAFLLTGCSGGCSDEAANGPQTSAMQEAGSAQEETDGNGAVTEKEGSEEEEAVILENEGDIEIVVPDGLESAGE